ncbi:MAG: helix-turn-helix domain-containing protein [Cryobacterium sp.]|nr:helix-turn-helix domain-containing protein [Cryobacterium sp.]MBX3104840.1 helix-turn-helix domain-containing protein [Cryobacterium sp.]
MTDSGPDYSVPALDKALDVLELLANQSGGLTQQEIAQAIERTPSQVFRVLQRLERRGWIVRTRPAGLYLLSTRMLDLANRQPKLRGLVAVAEPVMRELSLATKQSCNLSILDAASVVVIAQVETPADFGFRVRVGASFPLETPAGQVLTKHISGKVLQVADAVQPGITDLAVGITSHSGSVIAALTLPYIATSYSEVSVPRALELVANAGATISAQIVGEEVVP